MRRVSAALLMLVLCACDGRMDTAPVPAPADPSPGPADSTVASIDSAALIRADGIGYARAGMSIGDLRRALPSDTRLGQLHAYMVDIDALPVIRGADTLLHVLIPAGESSGDNAAITIVATDNDALRTAEGVGPGSTLEEAAAVYGAPTLAYNINDESREYATFPQLPGTIRVRVDPASDTSPYAGVYETQGEYNETAHFDPAATIMMVLVWMR